MILYLLAQLCALALQHLVHLLGRQIVCQQAGDLLERETQILQRQDAMQARQLVERVVAVAGKVIDFDRLEQANLIVVS